MPYLRQPSPIVDQATKRVVVVLGFPINTIVSIEHEFPTDLEYRFPGSLVGCKQPLIKSVPRSRIGKPVDVEFRRVLYKGLRSYER
jgi:hypothetical protein